MKPYTRSQLAYFTEDAEKRGSITLTNHQWAAIIATIEAAKNEPDAYELDKWAQETFRRHDTTTSLAEALMCVMETNVDITIQLADYADMHPGTAKRAVVFAGEPSPYDKDVLHEGPMDEEAMATAIMLHLWRELHD